MTPRNSRRFLAIGIFAAGVTQGCAATIDAHSLTFPTANRLTQLQTFAFDDAEVTPSEHDTSARAAAVRSRVRGLVAEFLEKRGYVPRVGDTDFVVVIAASRREREVVRPVFFPHPRPSGPAWFEDHEERDLVEGTLLIDVLGGRTREPLWHGAATVEIDPDHADDALLRNATTEVLALFRWSRAMR